MKTIKILQTEQELSSAFKEAEYNNSDLIQHSKKIHVEMVTQVYVLTGEKLKYLGLCPKYIDVLAVIAHSRFKLFKLEFVSKIWTSNDNDVHNRTIETFMFDKKDLLDLA